MKPRCDLVGVEKKPRPSGRRAGLSHTCLTLDYSRKARPSLPHRKQLGARGIGSRKKGPAEAGPSLRVISLRKEGYLDLPSWTIRQFGAQGRGSSGSERLRPECCRGATVIRSQWRFIGEDWIVGTSQFDLGKSGALRLQLPPPPPPPGPWGYAPDPKDKKKKIRQKDFCLFSLRSVD
jgi:hypothetical protein